MIRKFYRSLVAAWRYVAKWEAQNAKKWRQHLDALEDRPISLIDADLLLLMVIMEEL